MNIPFIVAQVTDHTNPVICFRSQNTYPVLFFSRLFTYLKNNKTLRIESCDLEEQNIADIKGRLSTSFLGTSTLYWMRAVSVLDQKIKQEFLQYVRNYLGPNRVVFFALHEDIPYHAKDTIYIDIPEHIDKQHAIDLLQTLCGFDATHAQQFAQAVFARHKEIALDGFCMLVQYGQLLNVASVSSFLDDWLEYILTPKASLFTLSTHFFAKDARLFFPLWVRIQHEYSPQFWVAYWAEQLWRAHGFLQLHKKNKKDDAKKMAFRLPFTFIQREWRNYSMRELKQAHAMMYTIDFRLKNGGNEHVLDLFFSKFFSNQFIVK